MAEDFYAAVTVEYGFPVFAGPPQDCGTDKLCAGPDKVGKIIQQNASIPLPYQ